MSEQPAQQPSWDSLSEPEKMSALFGQLVLQQTNMALMLLGKVAHPEHGQTYKDIDAARVFIDQLEMLETKTKGNLTREETTFIKQSLMSLRLAFVEAVESPAAAPTGKEPAGTPEPAAPAQAGGTADETSDASPEEHRKKFSKKY